MVISFATPVPSTLRCCTFIMDLFHYASLLE